MSAKAKESSSQAETPVAVVLFGLDEQGKPKAARFAEAQAPLASKAAAQLKLELLPIRGTQALELAARLPEGRIHANGRGFIPAIRRDLYVKLLELAGTAKASAGQPSAAAATANQGSATRQSGRLPPHWDEIGAGDRVIAQEGKEDGWYEANVIDRQNDMLILRWHNWPRDRSFSRHRLSVALMYPAAAPGSKEPTAPSTKETAKAEKAPTAAANGPALPRTWSAVDVGSLVLAREDGPMCGWWEALASERAGDKFTLRWRDYANAPSVSRERRELALLHPNGSPAAR